MIGKLKAEIYKNYIYIKRYPLEIASDFILYILIFGAIYISAKNHYQDAAARNEQVNRLIMSYTSWVFFSNMLNHISNNVIKEITQGTIDQLVLCDLNLAKTFIVRSIVYALRVGLLMVPFTCAEFLLTNGSCMFTIEFYLLFAIIAIGSLGLSLLMGGLTLRYKGIGKLSFLISIFFLGTAIFDFKDVLYRFGYLKYIFPFVVGQQMLKNITLHRFIAAEEYTFLAVNAIIYFFGGVWIFNRNYRAARLKGELNKI